MAEPQPVDPVKLIVAVLWSDAEALAAARERLESAWGTIDHEGPDRRFDVTGYYERELGPVVVRRLWSFAELVDPASLAERKLLTNRIEEELARDGKRGVNLDVGTLDHHKLVLASAKAAGQKVAIGRGIWADLMLRFRDGDLRPFEWTFPDFRDGRYNAELLEIRAVYLRELRERGG